MDLLLRRLRLLLVDPERRLHLSHPELLVFPEDLVDLLLRLLRLLPEDLGLL